jgi:hypothetical protein
VFRPAGEGVPRAAFHQGRASTRPLHRKSVVHDLRVVNAQDGEFRIEEKRADAPLDRLVGRRRRSGPRREVQHRRVRVRTDVAIAPELPIVQLDFDRQLHGNAFFEEEVFRVQLDRRIRTGNFDRRGQASETFVDVFVVLFLFRLRP